MQVFQGVLSIRTLQVLKDCCVENCLFNTGSGPDQGPRVGDTDASYVLGNLVWSPACHHASHEWRVCIIFVIYE